MRPLILINLIICNMIWAMNPVMGKWLLETYSPTQVAWLRFSGAALSFWVFIVALKFLLPRTAVSWPLLQSRILKDWFYVFVIGVSAFTINPILQTTGLHASRATDNALIVALEPLMHVLVAWIVLGEKVAKRYQIAFFISLIGFSLLSGVNPETLSSISAHLIGNLLIASALLGEAVFTSFSKKLIYRHSMVGVFGSALSVGALFLTFFLILWDEFPNLRLMPTKGLIAWIWLGPIGTAFTYFYWIKAIKDAPIPAIALTLFVQPVVGWIFGGLVLGEQLTFLQTLGALLLLSTLITQMLPDKNFKITVKSSKN